MGHEDQITTVPRPVPVPARPTHVRHVVLMVACSLAVLTYVQRQGLVLGWSVLTGVTALAAFFPPGGWLAFAFLLAVRFFFAMFQAGGFPVLARVLADWMPAQQRGFAQGLVWTFSRLGGFAAPVLFL